MHGALLCRRLDNQHGKVKQCMHVNYIRSSIIIYIIIELVSNHQSAYP